MYNLKNPGVGEVYRKFDNLIPKNFQIFKGFRFNVFFYFTFFLYSNPLLRWRDVEYRTTPVAVFIMYLSVFRRPYHNNLLGYFSESRISYTVYVWIYGITVITRTQANTDLSPIVPLTRVVKSRIRAYPGVPRKMEILWKSQNWKQKWKFQVMSWKFHNWKKWKFRNFL